MKKYFFFFLLSFVFFSPVFLCFAQSNSIEIHQVNVRILLEAPESYDGQTVQISGELIGQALYQKHGVWFHLLDEEGSAIGIWAQKEELPPLTYYGKFGVQGDRLSLRGTFFKACPIHGGDTDIHLLEIDEIHPGRILESEKVNPFKWYFLIMLLMLFLGLLLYVSRVGVNKTESQ
jgi:hypothetical protein